MEAIPMEDFSLSDGLHVPEHIWFELHHEEDACDVIVKMEDGNVYTALFITTTYLQRQMQLNYEISSQLPDTPPVRYCALETPHILVPDLHRDTIEDTIDNLLALDVFEGHFTRVTDDKTPTDTTTTEGKRATQEVAAVVISDVLVVND